MNKHLLFGAAIAASAAAAATAQPAGIDRTAAAVTRADFTARAEARFARADSNRDGYVTRDEVRAAAAAGPRRLGGEQRHERRAELFARLDVNRDGVLSRQEFEGGGIQGRGAAPRPLLRERGVPRLGDRARPGGLGLRAFAAADVDGDGRISRAEARARALQRFERLDLNHDGRISLEERREARETRQERRARRGA